MEITKGLTIHSKCYNTNKGFKRVNDHQAHWRTYMDGPMRYSSLTLHRDENQRNHKMLLKSVIQIILTKDESPIYKVYKELTSWDK